MSCIFNISGTVPTETMSDHKLFTGRQVLSTNCTYYMYILSIAVHAVHTAHTVQYILLILSMLHILYIMNGTAYTSYRQ